MSNTERDLLTAKKLIQEKRYEDAKALLITIDHPTADKWLQRLQTISVPTTSIPQTRDSDQDFTTKLVLTIVLLFFAFLPGLIALTIFKPQAQKHPAAPGAQGILLLSKITTWIMRILLVLIVILLVVLIITYLNLTMPAFQG